MTSLSSDFKKKQAGVSKEEFYPPPYTTGNILILYIQIISKELAAWVGYRVKPIPKLPIANPRSFFIKSLLSGVAKFIQ